MAEEQEFPNLTNTAHRVLPDIGLLLPVKGWGLQCAVANRE